MEKVDVLKLVSNGGVFDLTAADFAGRRMNHP